LWMLGGIKPSSPFRERNHTMVDVIKSPLIALGF
jgi:hypothetical protein